MTTGIRFLLQFSGPEIFDREKEAELLLDETSAADHAARARLLAIIAAARVITAPAEAAEVAMRASREGQAAGDAVSHAWSLIAACVVDVTPQTLSSRLSMTQDVLQIAQKTGEVEFVPIAYFLRLGALVEAGRIGELDLALSETGPVLSAFPWLMGERHGAWFRCLRMTIDGQAEQAEKLANDALRLAERDNDPDALSVWVGQLAIIRWMQGRVVELEPAFLQARQSAPHEPVWAASLAWMWLQQGRRSAARALLTSLPQVEDLPRDRNWLATACILAVVAAEVEHREIAGALRQALQPFAQRLVTIGLGVTCWGTVARPLALIAEALGDRAAAIEYYRIAVDVAARAGAHPWLAEAQTELASLLTLSTELADVDEAHALATDAMSTGRALQLRPMEEAAAVLLAPRVRERDTERPHASATFAPAHSPPRAKINVLGRFEVFSAQGTPARWQSRKARQLLQILVAKRGVALGRESIMHMLWPDVARDRLSNRFSVAASTVRRALDPEGWLPGDHYLEAQGGLVRLRMEQLDVDVEDFLARARKALSSTCEERERTAFLRTAFEAYRGDVYAEEPEDVWAHELRREAHVAYFAVAHALAETSASAGDELTRMECYRAILAADPYDQRAHEGLIATLRQIGASGRAAEATALYRQRMSQLGIGVHG